MPGYPEISLSGNCPAEVHMNVQRHTHKDVDRSGINNSQKPELAQKSIKKEGINPVRAHTAMEMDKSKLPTT